MTAGARAKKDERPARTRGAGERSVEDASFARARAPRLFYGFQPVPLALGPP